MEIFPRDVLLRVNPRTLGRLPYTFTRAAIRRIRDRDGIGRKVAAGNVAINYPGLVDAFGNPVATIRVDGARTQLVTNPENFGAWGNTGTLVLTSGQADPFGGTAAYLLTDNSAGVDQFISEATPFTADATKGYAVYVRKGTSAPASGSRISVFDSTAGTGRLSATLTWDGAGTPSLSVGQLGAAEAWAGGWWRLPIQVAGIIAANTNVLIFRPAHVLSETGDLFVFGANAWNAPFPSSYQGPGESAGAADAFSLSYNWGPLSEMSVLTRLARPAWASAAGTIGNRWVWEVGTALPNVNLLGLSAARTWRSSWDTSGSDSLVDSAIPAGTELRVLTQAKLVAGGQPQVAHDVGDGAGLSSFGSAASAVTQFGNQTLRIGSPPGEELYGDLIDLIVFRGLFSLNEGLAVP